MAPFIALVIVTVAVRVVGTAGLAYTDSWPEALAVGLSAMFILTASAHFVQPRRTGLIAIVPPAFPSPGVIVTITGYLEFLGAAGLLIPAGVVPGLRPAAAGGLALLLLAMFPANIYAARAPRGPSAPTTPLIRRTVLQAVFLAACVTVTFTSN